MPMTQDKAIDVRQTTFYNEFGEKMLDLSSYLPMIKIILDQWNPGSLRSQDEGGSHK